MSSDVTGDGDTAGLTDGQDHTEILEGTEGQEHPVGPRDAADSDQAVEDHEAVDAPGLRASLEAILLVADEPVPEVLLAQVLERPRHEVAAALRALSAEYTSDGRGFDVREIAGGWRFYTREDSAPLV